MRLLLTISVLIYGLFSLPSPPTGGEHVAGAHPLTDAAGPPEGGVQIVQGSNLEREAQLAEILANFAHHGLQPPAVDVRFDLPSVECRGAFGLFSPRVTRHQVSVCGDQPWVLVHELAHAWIHDNVDQPTRDKYLVLRDKPTWNSSAFAWKDRGFEDAAFVMQHLLTPRPSLAQSREWKSRRAAFELLTNAAPSSAVEQA